jgi:WD40 repeat protein
VKYREEKRLKKPTQHHSAAIQATHMTASPLAVISFLFDEASDEANALKQSLAAIGIPASLCAAELGGVEDNVPTSSFARAPLIIAMGTKTYGKKAVPELISYHELQRAMERDKPVFFIKMCEDLEEPLERFRLPSSDFTWISDPRNRARVPDGLVRLIKSKLMALTTVATEMEAGASLKRKFPDDSVSSAAGDLAAPSAKQQVSGEKAAARVWRELLKLEGHLGGVLAVIVSPDGKRIVSGSAAKYEESQDSLSGAEGDDDSEDSVSSTEGEEESEDNAIRMWDELTGKQMLTLEGHDAPVDALAISPDGSRLVSGSYDKTIRVWGARSGEQLVVLSGHTSVVRAVAISPDGRRIVSGSADDTMRVWDAHNGAQLGALEGHTSLVSAVAISPDGSKIVSGSWDATVRVWDLGTETQLMVLKGHTGWVTTVAISHDGQRIVSGSKDKTIRAWDARNGQQLSVLAGHVAGICAVAFFPDGKRVASGSGDKTIRVWDAQSGKQMAVLEGHTEAVYALAISSTGNDKIVSGSADKTIRVWAME